MEWGIEWIARYGYLAIFVLLMLGIIGLPVPDETLLLFAGYLSFKGELRLESTLATAFFGSACGISVSYAIGRIVGPHTIGKFAPLLHIRPAQLVQTYQWMERWGKYALLIAYFIPGVRHVSALLAGASLLPSSVFARFAYSGALVWSGTFIGLGYVTGEEWRYLSPLLHRTVLVGAGVVIFAFAFLIIVLRRRGQSAEDGTLR
jgi:membrane protein DedA with SNARE-associated domain